MWCHLPNLARRDASDAEKVNAVVRDELRRARVPEAPAKTSPEVFATVGGVLGGVTLTRLWTYWSAKGRVPLAVAEELYADPVGRTDIRVDGNCTCPEPRRWAVWIAPGGRRVLDRHNEAEFRKYAAMDPAKTQMAEIGREGLEKYLFADDPSAFPGVEGFVEGYHIDSELGLRIFADALRGAGLAPPV